MVVAPALAFADTNTLLYIYDGRDMRKQKIAMSLYEELLASGRGVISTQVIQEFCNVALKPSFAIKTERLPQVISSTLAPLLQHFPDPDYYIRGAALKARYGLSFYDALIVQAALDLGCTTLYSEDLQAGQTFGELTVVNPFV